MCEPYRSKARQRPETAGLGGRVFVAMYPKGAAGGRSLRMHGSHILIWTANFNHCINYLFSSFQSDISLALIPYIFYVFLEVYGRQVSVVKNFSTNETGEREMKVRNQFRNQ